MKSVLSILKPVQTDKLNLWDHGHYNNKSFPYRDFYYHSILLVHFTLLTEMLQRYQLYVLLYLVIAIIIYFSKFFLLKLLYLNDYVLYSHNLS